MYSAGVITIAETTGSRTSAIFPDGQSLGFVAHRQIRNRGTIGGSLAHADPAAELPAAALALDATLVAAGPAGRRRIAARDFFRGPLTTALEPREILIEIEIPGPVGAAWGFAEVARRAGDFAVAGVAAVLRPGPDRGRCATAHLAAFGCGDTPVRLAGAEAVLAGARIDAGVARSVAESAAQICAPRDDLHATADYRRHLIAVLTEQVVLEAAAALAASRLIGYVVRDVLVTEEELKGLMANLVVTDGPATGHRRLSDWLADNAATVGRRYASEVSRHYSSGQ